MTQKNNKVKKKPFIRFVNDNWWAIFWLFLILELIFGVAFK